MNPEILARMPGSFQALARFALTRTTVEKEKDAAKADQGPAAEDKHDLRHIQPT